MRGAQAMMSAFSGEKPHSSITDWIEVLSSDRYEEGSLDGIPELVDSVNLQGGQGTTEAARAIRKKLKYGNVHRQIRALVILHALTENAGSGFKLNWANAQLMERLRDMATDVSERGWPAVRGRATVYWNKGEVLLGRQQGYPWHVVLGARMTETPRKYREGDRAPYRFAMV